MFGERSAAGQQAKARLRWEQPICPKTGFIGKVPTRFYSDRRPSLQTDQPTRASDSKRLTVLSPAERTALYGLPDFDDFQRADFFAMTEAERALADRRKGPVERLHCLLQIGYFKAKQAFFNFDAQDIATEDIEFLVGRYFRRETVALRPLRQDERYTQRTEIAKLFGYRLWSATDRPGLIEMAALLARRDVKPTFILVEVLGLLKVRKYRTPWLYDAANHHQRRTRGRARASGPPHRKGLGCQHMRGAAGSPGARRHAVGIGGAQAGCQTFRLSDDARRATEVSTLAPLDTAAKVILPRLGISQQNTRYYASLVHYYTIFDLRRMTAGQRHLYLLCYAWERYRQINDNLADAFSHGMAQIEQETKEASEEAYAKAVEKRQREAPRVGRVLLLYVNETVDDTTPFGEVRKRAFTIMPKEDLLTAGNRLCERSDSQIELRWRAVDRAAGRFKRTLRPLAMTIDFSAEPAGRPWRAGLSWMKDVFNCQQRLAQRPLAEVPADTMPERLRPYLFDFDEAGKPTRLRGDRYEFWVYRQLRKRLVSGELYLDDSVRHRRFSDELVDPVRTPEVLKNLSIPWLRQPADVTVGALCDELDRLWRTFDHDLRAGKLKHLEFDPEHNTLSWRKPRIDRDEALQSSFYAKLQARAVPDVFRFVNARCGFLSALTPLQPRYAKKIADEDSLMAVIVAQAMNHGMLGMAETSDISYDVLEETHQQHLRLATLREANDKISNFIAGLDIFPLYSFGTETLYGGVDGQKFEAATPTIKARYSRKYFGRGKGVVAYTLLANHVPLETELIGANEHESHYVFDICYNNTSDIVPTAITGDMHIINKANFAVTYWFGLKLSPRFTNLQAQVQHLYCGTNPPEENPYLLQPAGQIDRQAIVADDNIDIDRIIATLGTQGSQSKRADSQTVCPVAA